MSETNNNSLFSEISSEESATVNGGSHRCGSHGRHYGGGYGYNVDYSPRRRHRHSRTGITFGIVVRYR